MNANAKNGPAAVSIGSKEHNNHLEGREGSETQQHEGPAVRGRGRELAGNKTSGGGINRSTKGL